MIFRIFSGRLDDNKAEPGCYDAIAATAKTRAKDSEEDSAKLGSGEEEQQADEEGEEGGGGGERLGRKLNIQPGSGRWAWDGTKASPPGGKHQKPEGWWHHT